MGEDPQTGMPQTGTCEVCGVASAAVSRTYRFGDWKMIMQCTDVDACMARREKAARAEVLTACQHQVLAGARRHYRQTGIPHD
jgi:hypothetical protein